MIFETRPQKKFKKKVDKQGNIHLDSLWQSVDMDEWVLPQKDHLVMTSQAFKKQANLFVRRLAKAGAFEKFSLAQQKEAEYGWAPKGYEVVLKMPLQCGGNYHISNFVLMPKGCQDILYTLYGKQITEEIEKNPHKKIQVSFPHIPDFLSIESFPKILYPEDRKPVLDFFKKQKILRTQSTQKVIKSYQGKKVIFKLKKATELPYSFRSERVCFPSLLDRDKVWKEYLENKEDLLCQAIERGDFGALDKKAKERLLKTHQLSLHSKWTCHHILPRQLGGKNNLENIVWMEEGQHKKLHTEVLNPLVEAVLGEAEKGSSTEYVVWLPLPLEREKNPSKKPPSFPFKRAPIRAGKYR